ncbi:unnamed protein product [Lota lota]
MRCYGEGSNILEPPVPPVLGEDDVADDAGWASGYTLDEDWLFGTTEMGGPWMEANEGCHGRVFAQLSFPPALVGDETHGSTIRVCQRGKNKHKRRGQHTSKDMTHSPKWLRAASLGLPCHTCRDANAATLSLVLGASQTGPSPVPVAGCPSLPGGVYTQHDLSKEERSTKSTASYLSRD